MIVIDHEWVGQIALLEIEWPSKLSGAVSDPGLFSTWSGGEDIEIVYSRVVATLAGN